MLIEFTASASELHRACTRLAGQIGEIPEDEEKAIEFKVTAGRLGITVDGTAANLMADVQSAGIAFIPSTVLAGVRHMLPYFGNRTVEIGFSNGKMRVDGTVFHSREILLSSAETSERRRPSYRNRTLQTF